MMHGHGKSDHAVVAGKPANNAGRSAAEPVEPRAGTKGNAGQQSACRTQGRANASQALERIRQAFAVWTRGRSRMRESCMYGSERGARGNSRPYRDRTNVRSATRPKEEKMKMVPQVLFWLGLISIPFAWLVWYFGPQLEVLRPVLASISDPALRAALQEAHAERLGIWVGVWPVSLLVLSQILEKKMQG